MFALLIVENLPNITTIRALYKTKCALHILEKAPCILFEPLCISTKPPHMIHGLNIMVNQPHKYTFVLCIAENPLHIKEKVLHLTMKAPHIFSKSTTYNE